MCSLKPIFTHLGPRIALDPQRDNFIVGITASKASRTQRESQPTQRKSPSKQVEYNLYWVSQGWVRVEHVDFMFFVSFFWLNTGLTVSVCDYLIFKTYNRSFFQYLIYITIHGLGSCMQKI